MCAGMGRRKFPAKKILYFKYSGIYVAEIMHKCGIYTQCVAELVWYNNYVADDLCTSVVYYTNV
jgi:hypothetical protein